MIFSDKINTFLAQIIIIKCVLSTNFLPYDVNLQLKKMKLVLCNLLNRVQKVVDFGVKVIPRNFIYYNDFFFNLA
jgi:hypothetical protein